MSHSFFLVSGLDECEMLRKNSGRLSISTVADDVMLNRRPPLPELVSHCTSTVLSTAAVANPTVLLSRAWYVTTSGTSLFSNVVILTCTVLLLAITWCTSAPPRCALTVGWSSTK